MADNIDFRVKHGLAVTNTATVESNLQATSTATGALRVAGGAGIGGNLYVGGLFSSTGVIAAIGGITVSSTGVFTADTDSTSTNTGALIVTGGVGIGENLNVGGTLTVWSTATSVSPTTGALQVKGGVGILGDMWVQGTLYGSITGSVSTATHLGFGTAGQVPYQTEPGRTSFFGPGTAGQYLRSNGASAPSYVDTATIYVGYSVTATDLTAGAVGSIPYQAGAGDTTFLNIGSAGQLLTVNAGGTAPQWSNTTSVVVGVATTATNASNIATVRRTTAASHYLTFVDSDNAASAYELLYTQSGIVYNPSTQRLGVAVTTPNATLDVAGTMFVSGISTVTNTTNATSTATGAFQVRGGAAVGLNLVVGSTATILSQAYSSSTAVGNALYVAGGVGIGRGLYVGGPVLFQDNVTFSGTTTNVYSTNTVYTDNFIDLHFPSGAGGTGGVWSVDDGKDIGHIYHHYKESTGDDHGALIWHNESDELRWYMGNLEYVGGSQTWSFTTATYGEFRAGAIYLESTTTSIGTDTGALTVAGGAGIAGDLYVGGVIYGVASVTGTISTATSLASGTTGQIPFQTEPGATSFFGPGTAGQILVSAGTTSTGPTFTSTGSIYVGYAANANNLIAGTAGQVPYQSSTGTTTFTGPGTAGQILISQGTSGPVFSNTSTIGVNFASNADNIKLTNDVATSTPQYLTFVSTTTGFTGLKGAALSGLTYVPSTGNLGVGIAAANAKLDVAGGVFISGVTTVTNVTNASSTATGAFQVRGGAAVGLDLYVGGSETIGGDLAVNGGDITSSAATFNFVDTGVTTLNIARAGTAITIGSNSAGTTTIRNITNITTGTNATSTTTGALIVTGGAGFGGDVYARNIYSNGALVGGSATTATNLANGTAGQVPYQTAPGVTSFYGPGTAGQLLMSSGTSAPVYMSTGSIYVGKATAATNIDGGAAGSLPYQTGAAATTFLSIGSAGSMLVVNGAGTAPTWASTGSLVAGNANNVLIANDTSNTATHYLTFVSTSTGYTNVKTSAFTGITYVPSNNFVGIGTNTPAYTLDVNSTTNAIIRAFGTSIGRLSLQNSTRHYSLSVQGANLLFYDETGGATRATLTSAGNFGINVTPAFTLDVGGAARISGVTTVTNTTAATSTVTGALQVQGGVGVGGRIYSSGGVYAINTITTGDANFVAITNGTTSSQKSGMAFYGTFDNFPSDVGTRRVADIVAGFTATVANTGGTWSTQFLSIHVGRDAAANDGQLINIERVRITNSSTFILHPTASTSSVTGALIVSGGVGIQGATFFGGNTSLAGINTVTNTTNASSTATGALQVYGGVGIGGNLYVGGTMYGAFFGSITGTATTATNIAGGTAGQVPYQSSTGTTSFFGPGTAGQLLMSSGTSAPVYMSTGSVYVGKATNSTNLDGGAQGSLPYQSGANATTFLGIGSAGSMLVVNSGATAPIWVSTATFVAGNANNVLVTNDVASTTPHFITFVSTTTGYTGVKGAALSGLTYIPSSGYHGFGVATPTATLDVAGGARLTGVTTITNVTQATTTVTGALQIVNGGAGIGGNVFAGGYVWSNTGVYSRNSFQLRDSTTSTTVLASLEQQSVHAVLEFGRTDISSTPAIDFHSVGATTDYDARISSSGGSTTTNGLATLSLIAGQVFVPTATTATSTQTGALRVTGGVSVGENLFVYGRIVGGFNTIATGTNSAVVGGLNNNASAPYTFVGGGAGNTIAAGSGGTYNLYSSIVGGQSNVITGSGSGFNHNFIGSGSSNTITWGGGSTIVGGASNVIQSSTKFYQFVGGGQSNTANGGYAVIVGGQSNVASGDYSQAGGLGATTRGITGARAWGYRESSAGDAQTVEYLLTTATTTATVAGTLTADRLAGGTANQIIMPNNSAYGYKGMITARDTTNGWISVWEVKGGIRRGASAATTQLIGTPVIDRITYDTTASTWSIDAVADTTNGGLQLTVSGSASSNIKWLAQITTVEVA